MQTLAINRQVEDPLLSCDRFLIIFRFFEICCGNNDSNRSQAENDSEDEVKKVKKEEVEMSTACLKIKILLSKSRQCSANCNFQAEMQSIEEAAWWRHDGLMIVSRKLRTY